MHQLKVLAFFSLLFAFLACKSKSESSSMESVTPVLNQDIVSEVDSALFFQAALDGNISVVQQALKSGINVNALELGNRTALMLASFNGHNDIAQLLIEEGADVNVTDENNRTALMFAASGPFHTTVEALLKAGANPNIVDSHEQWTAAMFAAAEGHLDNLKLLVEAGADLELKDTDGETAYDFAIAQNHNEVANYLKTK